MIALNNPHYIIMKTTQHTFKNTVTVFLLLFVSIGFAQGPSNLVSDDFCDGTLGSQWTFVNPLDDGTLQYTGASTQDAFLELSVPAGPEHQIWTNGIQAGLYPRLLFYKTSK